VALAGADTKNRQGADLPLRADLVEDLRRWVEATGKAGADKLFRVPVELVKILKRDLALAGVAYKDKHGRTFDVHSFRYTAATYLGKGKVAPRLSQGFMRHSDIKLTLQTYADPSLLDEAEALAALPRLPLPAGGGQIDTQDEVDSRPAGTGRAAP
jgi:integrase